jgi:hypothetical protein
MNEVQDRSQLDTALTQLESVALYFAQRFINDGEVRRSYIEQTKKLSDEYRAKVKAGMMTAESAAEQVQTLRNQILEAQRLHSSDIGKAKAVNLKASGITLETLTEKYAQAKFGKSFAEVSAAARNEIYLEIIESAGRSRPSVNLALQRFSKLGRGLMVVTLGIAVYNVAVADNKGKAVAREGVVLGGGFAGGAAGGALAGLACGPGAPVCVTLGVFVGGALGAMGADISFGWLF